MIRIICLTASLLLTQFGCAGESVERYAYNSPENINDGLEIGTLDEVNIDPTLIVEAVNEIRRGTYPEVHSMLIFKDGRLVLEEYFEGHRFEYDSAGHHGELVNWDKTMSHRVMSVTKSITSICIGIAVDKGFIESVHQSIFDYLPDYQHLSKEGRDKITVEHLLSMTSGLEWNEWAVPYGNPQNDVIQMYFVEDPVAYALEKPLTGEPGRSFNYAGGNNIILGEILENATGMKLDEFSGEYLFGPLGITPYHWARYRNGVVDAAGSVVITPRDMAKIGATFLNGGVWGETQIVSAEWVQKSAEPYPGNSWTNDWNDHYGMKGYAYSWWTHHFVHSGQKIDMFHAAGWGGQFIMVIPDFNTVVIFTGGNYTSKRPSFEILKKYLVPAIG